MESKIRTEIESEQARLREELENLDDNAPDYDERCLELKRAFDSQPVIVGAKVKRNAIVNLLSSKRIHANLY
jgi:hypothetical protein